MHYYYWITACYIFTDLPTEHGYRMMSNIKSNDFILKRDRGARKQSTEHDAQNLHDDRYEENSTTSDLSSKHLVQALQTVPSTHRGKRFPYYT